jgi:hypothetical protein
MSFEIKKPERPPVYISDRRLYLAEDKSTVVEEGDLRARTLLVGEGSEIEQTTAHALGIELVDGKLETPAQRGAAQPAPAEEPTEL